MRCNQGKKKGDRPGVPFTTNNEFISRRRRTDRNDIVLLEDELMEIEELPFNTSEPSTVIFRNSEATLRSRSPTMSVSELNLGQTVVSTNSDFNVETLLPIRPLMSLSSTNDNVQMDNFQQNATFLERSLEPTSNLLDTLSTESYFISIPMFIEERFPEAGETTQTSMNIPLQRQIPDTSQNYMLTRVAGHTNIHENLQYSEENQYLRDLARRNLRRASAPP